MFFRHVCLSRFLFTIDDRVRLVGSDNEWQGTVEVFSEGAWGTVCDDFWDILDARVVCRSLGYTDSVSAVGGAAFGQGTGTIVLDNVECDGTELSLLDCESLSRNNCEPGHAAGVVCSSSGNLILCTDSTWYCNESHLDVCISFKTIYRT